MRDRPLRMEGVQRIDYTNAALKMLEIKQYPKDRFMKEYETPMWWAALGILFTGVLLAWWKL